MESLTMARTFYICPVEFIFIVSMQIDKLVHDNKILRRENDRLDHRVEMYYNKNRNMKAEMKGLMRRRGLTD